MPELIVTRGVPASGKSTWALEWIAEDPEHRCRVNRDGLRDALYGKPAPLDRYQEEAISVAQRASVEAMLRGGVSVVVDDTHVREQYVRRWERLAYSIDAVDFRVNEVFREVPVQVCIDRDAARSARGERSVGPVVIGDMHGRLRGQPPFAYMGAEPQYTYVPNPSLPSAWLFDMDGTLARMDGRGPYEWHRVGEDACNENLASVARALRLQGAHIVVVSGRDACCRQQTLAWLVENDIPFDALLMRPEGDTRKDSLVKMEILERDLAPRFHVLGAFDDRDQVVEAWRRAGLQCFQVAPGNF